MTNGKYSEDEIKQLRERVKYEDGVLNSRTSLILTFNGLMAIAASISNLPPNALRSLSIIVLIVDVLWLTCSSEAWWVIKKLTDAIRSSKHVPVDEKLRSDVVDCFLKVKSLRIGPSLLLGLLLPMLLIVFWVVILALAPSYAKVDRVRNPLSQNASGKDYIKVGEVAPNNSLQRTVGNRGR